MLVHCGAAKSCENYLGSAGPRLSTISLIEFVLRKLIKQWIASKEGRNFSTHKVILVDVCQLLLNDLQGRQILADDAFALLKVVLHVKLDRQKNLLDLRLLLQLSLVRLQQVQCHASCQFNFNVLQKINTSKVQLTFLRQCSMQKRRLQECEQLRNLRVLSMSDALICFSFSKT